MTGAGDDLSQSKEYDNGTRAVMWNAIIDIFYCLLCPGVVFYGAPTIRRRVSKLLGRHTASPPPSLVNVKPREQETPASCETQDS